MDNNGMVGWVIGFLIRYLTKPMVIYITVVHVWVCMGMYWVCMGMYVCTVLHIHNQYTTM